MGVQYLGFKPLHHQLGYQEKWTSKPEHHICWRGYWQHVRGSQMLEVKVTKGVIHIQKYQVKNS